MALTAANVRVAVTGAVYAGPTTSDAPTAHASVLDADFIDLGFVSEDGVTETHDRTTEQIRAWQASSLVREVLTEASIKYDLTLIETKKEVVELFYGATVAAADGQIDIDPGITGGVKSFVIDVIDGSAIVRIYIARGEVTEIGEQVYTSGEAIGYPVTITAYESSGVTVTKWYSTLIV